MSEDSGHDTPDEKISMYAHDGGSRSISSTDLTAIIRDVQARNLPFRFEAPGFSMSPFIRDKDVITIIPYQRTSCGIGRVVAFIRPATGKLVVHRVVAASGDGWRIKGDNSPEEDGTIPHTAIIGQVVLVERAGRVVQCGQGSERIIIAMLSRWRILWYLLYPAGLLSSGIRRIL